MTTTAALPKGRSNWAISTHGPKPPAPCAIVIFGITGDLANRLLFPALYNLARYKLLPDSFAVAGFALTEISEHVLRNRFTENLKHTIGPEADMDSIHWLVSRVRYIAADFGSPDGWHRLHDVLAELDREHGTRGNYLFHMATAPEFFLRCAVAHHTRIIAERTQCRRPRTALGCKPHAMRPLAQSSATGIYASHTAFPSL